MLQLIKPNFEDLSFRKELLADEATMSYNANWGGTIDFSFDQWKSWYEYWIEQPEKRYYRYLYSETERTFIGEVAYYFHHELNEYICDIIIKDHFRGRGFGRQGLLLLLQEIKKQGITRICDNIGLDNPAIHLFKQVGFVEKYTTEEFIMLEKQF